MPASLASAAIGVFVVGSYLIFATGGDAAASPADMLAMIIFGGFGLAMAVIGATFIIGFYLCLFGLPVALLLGDRIRHQWALVLALGDALLGTAIATGGSRLGLMGGGDFAWQAYAVVLAFALPAGYLYRGFVIANRDANDWT